MDLILASSSPRRAQLLKELGFSFTINKYDFDEEIPPHISPQKTALFLSQYKADQLTSIIPGTTIITADTIVLAQQQVIGKPTDKEHAIHTLESLSGHTHHVVTGVTLTSSEKSKSFEVTTEVTFKTLSKEIIAKYVTDYKPYDKAGSYGIQEWLGLVGIEKINGSFYNVMGLPTSELYDALISF